jgi:hypothetical protein
LARADLLDFRRFEITLPNVIAATSRRTSTERATQVSRRFA